MAIRIRRPGRLSFVILGILFLVFLYDRSIVRKAVRDAKAVGRHTTDAGEEISKLLVVVTTKKKKHSETWWVREELPNWPSIIYVADDLDAPYHPAVNKGNEANVYLEYLITHYDKLPSVVVFTHDHNTAVHIDGGLATNANSVRRLNLTHVLAKGYQSLRCARESHCVLKTVEYWNRATPDYCEAWNYAYDNTVECPKLVVGPCCAQFAVSRDAIQRNSRQVYKRLQHWLVTTPLDNFWSGRVLEYMWHVLFGKPGVFCVDQDACYCNAFGLCDPDPDRGWWPDMSLEIFKDMQVQETINE